MSEEGRAENGELKSKKLKLKWGSDMTLQEFSDQFDLLYNNISSDQALGLTEYEKSVFLTKA